MSIELIKQNIEAEFPALKGHLHCNTIRNAIFIKKAAGICMFMQTTHENLVDAEKFDELKNILKRISITFNTGVVKTKGSNLGQTEMKVYAILINPQIEEKYGFVPAIPAQGSSFSMGS